jgi:RNA polymerase sigma factor (sigma-70 family)
MDEQNLIVKAKSGDNSAITRLLMENRNLVAAVVSRLVYEPENRKDVIQSVFMHAIRGIAEFNSSCRFSSWLYRLTVNQAVDYNRKKLQIRKIADAFNFDPDFNGRPSPDGFDSVSKKELANVINEALEKVPLDQKAAFNMFYFCGHSGKECAEVMKITEDNFFMKLKAARDRIRKVLVNKGWAQ